MKDGIEMCEWCGAVVDETHNVVGEQVCNECYNNYQRRTCRQCGCVTDTREMYKGLCIECAQDEVRSIEEYKEFVENDLTGVYIGESMSDEQYNEVMSKGVNKDSIGPEDIVTNTVMRKIFILVKVTASGTADKGKVEKNMRELDELVLKNINRIIGVDSKLAVIDNATGEEYEGYRLVDSIKSARLYIRK